MTTSNHVSRKLKICRHSNSRDADAREKKPKARRLASSPMSTCLFNMLRIWEKISSGIGVSHSSLAILENQNFRVHRISSANQILRFVPLIANGLMDAGYYNTLYTIPQTPKTAHAATI